MQADVRTVKVVFREQQGKQTEDTLDLVLHGVAQRTGHRLIRIQVHFECAKNLEGAIVTEDFGSENGLDHLLVKRQSGLRPLELVQRRDNPEAKTGIGLKQTLHQDLFGGRRADASEHANDLQPRFQRPRGLHKGITEGSDNPIAELGQGVCGILPQL